MPARADGVNRDLTLHANTRPKGPFVATDYEYRTDAMRNALYGCVKLTRCSSISAAMLSEAKHL
jgi:hypothetical protein